MSHSTRTRALALVAASALGLSLTACSAAAPVVARAEQAPAVVEAAPLKAPKGPQGPKVSTEGLSITANGFHNLWLDSLDLGSTDEFRASYLPSCTLCEAMADDMDAQLAEGWRTEGGSLGRGLFRLATTTQAKATKKAGTLTGVIENQGYTIVDAEGVPVADQPALESTQTFTFTLVDGLWVVSDLTVEV